MHKTVGAALAALGLLLATPVLSAEGIKVGFVNAPKVLEQAPQAEASREQLKSEFATRDHELVARQEEMKKLEDKLARDGAVLSDGEIRELEREIRNVQRELTRLQREFREDFNIRRNEELRKLQRTAMEAVVALAKEEGFDLILSEGVAYASERVDLTERVIEQMRKRFKAAPKK